MGQAALPGGAMASDHTAYVLVGMSPREVQDRENLLGWAETVGATVAFLQFGSPTVGTELTRIADTGCRRVVLVGASLGRLSPGASWLRRIAAHWWRQRSGPAPELACPARLLTQLEDWPTLVAEARPITGTEAGLTSPAWESITGHRHQVLVCRGPRCSAAGSEQTLEAMVLALMRHELGDDDVLLTHTGCQFPCNQAPVVSVQPDDIWYGAVSPEVAEQIVAEHLVGDRSVESHRLPRMRGDAAEDG
ncbi:MAG: (2Fe-2S) ferredoxin domain-containing protein [Nocardioides sp.]|uniref:(2Fe-2S) ferredoxin domain-containing protein n=1 Tax=Nocardioides sp. TaxID=35761 RepID=UPI0039E5AB20